MQLPVGKFSGSSSENNMKPTINGTSHVDHNEPATTGSNTFQQPIVDHVCGKLVARSHILQTRPPYFLMSLSGHENSILIKVNASQAVNWISSLNIHSTYKFSDLVCSSMTFNDPHEIVNFFNTTQSSIYVKLDSIASCINPWLQANNKLINYQGVVTSAISPLGLIVLDDKISLCVFFVCSYMDLNWPLQGQEVKIFNAHLTANMLVMCCRSSFHVLGDHQCVPLVNLPLSHIVDTTFGYGDYRWLQKQVVTLEQKFGDDFLLSDISKESCQVLRINALARLLGLSSHCTHISMNIEQLIRDFLSISHPCILYKQPQKSRPIVRFLKEQFEFFNKFFEHSVCSPLPQPLPYWSWSTHDISTGNDLVGYLNVSEVDGYWQLSDTSFTTPCIINKQPQADFQGQFVSLRQYKVIIEKFLVPDTNGSVESKMYLFISHDITSLGKTSILSILEGYISPIQHVGGCCTLCSTARRHIQDELTFSGCCEQWKTDDMINLRPGRVTSLGKHVHAVVVHYVATPMKLRDTVYCFILVSVLQSSSHHAEAGAFPCILVLDGKLIRALPLLELGVAYYLHLPIRQDVRTFTHAKLNTQLPWSVVQLPEETIFSRHVCTHSGSWWALRDHASKGMCSVEGIVETRKELPPKFDSELADNNRPTPGYGEPNLRTIMVVVQDEGTSHTLYLNHWNKRRYPLGLVPGARICATLVKHTTSSSNNEYFQATDLTAVDILNFPNMKHISFSDAWSPPCDITLASAEELESTVCGLVDSWMILSVVITAVCGGCKLLRLNGSCEFPGCLASEDCVTFIANARISINGMGGKKVVHLKDENVREMLNFTKNDWNVLLSLSREHELKFKKCFDTNQRQFHSDAENIFQLYCIDPTLTNRCVYIRCKGFKKSDNTEESSCSSSMKTESIFCLELTNESPWQV